MTAPSLADFIARQAAAQREFTRTYNGHPVQEGPISVSGLVRGWWQDERVPTCEQAAERVRVYLSWGATVVNVRTP